jgi:MoxR-like ATPase
MRRLDLTRAQISAETYSGRPDRPRLLYFDSIYPTRVTEDQFRIAAQYIEARERLDKQSAARARYRPPPPEPPLEALEPQEKLTPRQEAFCRHYAARPVAARAAMLAGYSSQSAGNRGWKLLRHPLVLARLAEIRAQEKLRYEIEPDTVHDKLETVFFEAIESGNLGAAVTALRLQVALAGLLDKGRAGARVKPEGDKGNAGG